MGAAGPGCGGGPLFARDRGQRAAIAQATFRANQVDYGGIPLASALGGRDALIFASLVTSVCVPVFNMLAVLMLTAYSTDGKSISWREEVRQIFRNPLILGALAGLVTVLVRQLLPQVDGQPVFSLRYSSLPSIYKACSDLSKVASPLVLVILGARLRFDAVQGLWKKDHGGGGHAPGGGAGDRADPGGAAAGAAGADHGGNAHDSGHLLLTGSRNQRGDGPGDRRGRAAGPASV